MNYSTSQLSKTLKTTVCVATPLTASFGLRLRLANAFDLSAHMEPSDEGFYSRTLCDLADEHGVVVIHNARASALPRNNLSFESPVPSRLKHMFFHAGSGTTLMTKTGETLRRAPSVFALADDVRAAVGRVDKNLLPLNTDLALKILGDDQFSFRKRDLKELSFILDKAPTLINRVIDALPIAEVYTHTWDMGEPVAVLHSSNFKSGLLQARPAGEDRSDPVRTATLRRTSFDYSL